MAVKNVGKKGRNLSEQEALSIQTDFSGYKKYEEPIFTTGAGAVELDVLTDTGFNTHGGYIACNRSQEATPELGELEVELAEEDGAAYGEKYTLTPGDIFSLDGHDVAKIRLTAPGDNCRYRVFADKLYL